MMPAPPTLTLVSLDEGQDTSVMSLTAGAGGIECKGRCGPWAARQPFDCVLPPGYDPG